MKKIMGLLLAMVFVFTISGCGSNNKDTNNNIDNDNKQQEESYTLTNFESDIKSLIPDMEKTDIMYDMIGAIDGYKIYNNADNDYKLEIYQYDKSSEDYKTAEADQKIYLGEMGVAATVKNGYALLIDDDFPSKTEIMKLFDKLK